MTNAKEDKNKSKGNKKKAQITETTKEKSRKIEFKPGSLYNNIPNKWVIMKDGKEINAYNLRYYGFGCLD